MRFVVPAVLVMVAIIHALPILGVLGANRLFQLYGITVDEPNLEILLRHRAVMFGLVAVLLAYAAIRPQLQRLALAVGFVSVGSFLVLALSSGAYNEALATVVRADWLALVLLLVGAIAHAARAR
ncbi:MAG: phosphopantetheine adenylyltransferase [Chitinophagaceae bacterium]|nr:phosphopantetheine adenylyltransferase [Rubrivivax sp.]